MSWLGALMDPLMANQNANPITIRLTERSERLQHDRLDPDTDVAVSFLSRRWQPVSVQQGAASRQVRQHLSARPEARKHRLMDLVLGDPGLDSVVDVWSTPGRFKSTVKRTSLETVGHELATSRKAIRLIAVAPGRISSRIEGVEGDA